MATGPLPFVLEFIREAADLQVESDTDFNARHQLTLPSGRQIDALVVPTGTACLRLIDGATSSYLMVHNLQPEGREIIRHVARRDIPAAMRLLAPFLDTLVQTGLPGRTSWVPAGPHLAQAASVTRLLSGMAAALYSRHPHAECAQILLDWGNPGEACFSLSLVHDGDEAYTASPAALATAAAAGPILRLREDAAWGAVQNYFDSPPPTFDPPGIALDQEVELQVEPQSTIDLLRLIAHGEDCAATLKLRVEDLILPV